MSEKRNRRDLINEIIEKLQFELDPRARHYIKNFSVTMRLRPPEVAMAPTEGSGGTCKEVCSEVQCMEHTDSSDCPKEVCNNYGCPKKVCQTNQDCPHNSCNLFTCKSLSEVSHYSSLGNADVRKSLKSKMKE